MLSTPYVSAAAVQSRCGERAAVHGPAPSTPTLTVSVPDLKHLFDHNQKCRTPAI